MKYVLLPIVCIMFIHYAMAQSISINNDGSTPHASALLDVKSTTKGLLAPRMTTAQRLAITSPAAGLLVYDTDTKNFWVYTGTDWDMLVSAASNLWSKGVTAGNIITSQIGNVGINYGEPMHKLSVGGDIYAKQDLVADRNLYINNDSWVAGNSLVSGALEVGLQTNIHGQLNILNGSNIVVNSKGIVKSNSATQLRMGFASAGFDLTLSANAIFDITVPIIAFTGNNNNIRISISQFAPDANASEWEKFVLTIHSIDAVANSCKLRVYNSGTTTNRISGVLYLLCVATD